MQLQSSMRTYFVVESPRIVLVDAENVYVQRSVYSARALRIRSYVRCLGVNCIAAPGRPRVCLRRADFQNGVGTNLLLSEVWVEARGG